MEVENDDWVQFYGVIIDATFPYKCDENKYICNLKVIDPSMHIKDGADNEAFATVIIQGRRF
jgi:hypothetical protein